MNKLQERLALFANLAVVVGIGFLVAELQQNTRAIQAQTRDSVTEKQMEFYGWVATNRDLANVYATYRDSRHADIPDPVDRLMIWSYWQGIFREWENSHYQYRLGLFEADEYRARIERWRSGLGSSSARDIWRSGNQSFAPDFRTEIDRIVEERESQSAN